MHDETQRGAAAFGAQLTPAWKYQTKTPALLPITYLLQDAAPLSPRSSQARVGSQARPGFLGQSRMLVSQDENGGRGLLGSQRLRLPSVSMYARLQEGPGGN